MLNLTTNTTVDLINGSHCMDLSMIYDAMDTSSRYGFAVFSIIIGLIGILVNSLTVHLIVRTKQHRNQSMKLLMYISCIEVLNGCICCIHAVQILFDIPCFVFVIIQYLKLFSIMNTAPFAIVIDRYIRIKHLNNYDQVLTRTRFQILFIGYLIFTVITTVLIQSFNYFLGYGSAKIFFIPIMTLGGIFITTLYILSVLKLSRHAREKQNISNSTKMITRATKIYFFLTVFGMTYTILVNQVLGKFILNNYRELFAATLKIVAFNLSTILGVLNALVLIKLNRKMKNCVISIFITEEE